MIIIRMFVVGKSIFVKLTVRLGDSIFMMMLTPL